MSLFSDLLSAEGLLRAFQVIAIATGLLAVAALIGKDVTNNIVSGRRAKDLLALQKEVADARTKQAEAEMQLAEVKRQQDPRRVDLAFLKALEGQPKGEAEVLYQPEDAEAASLALGTFGLLHSAGWKLSGLPIPIPSNAATRLMREAIPEELLHQFPAVVRVGGSISGGKTGVFIVATSQQEPPFGKGSPSHALYNAFFANGIEAKGGFDGDLPVGKLRIVIGSH